MEKCARRICLQASRHRARLDLTRTSVPPSVAANGHVFRQLIFRRQPHSQAPSPPSPTHPTSIRAFVLSAAVFGGLAAAALSLVPNTSADSPPSERKIRLAEVKQHGSDSDHPWVIKGNHVYDITDWIPAHPGGNVILRAAGGTIDQYWQIFANHNQQYVLDILEQFRIGEVDPHDLVDGKIPQENIQDPFVNDPERDARLKVLSARPCNAESQGAALDSYITPNEVFYVRNHLWVPPVKDETSYELVIEGRDGEEKTYSLEELRGKFQEHTITAVLQCSGNRRAHMSTLSRTAQGLQWGIGAIGNAQWTGVLLRDVLEDAGLDTSAPPEDIKHAQFKGTEAYGASIPIDKAVDRKGDVLLAYQMNGKPLPPDHGFPLRVIVPGYVAARSVKWVNRIILSDEESESQWQRRDYKCFGPNQGARQINWDAAPAIQEMPVQSAITKVTDITTGDRTALEVYGLEEDSVAVEGYAFSGGGRRIIRVDISANNGHTWDQAELVAPPEDTPALGNRAWGWQRWQYRIPRSQVGRWFLVKAVDEAYNAQPSDYDSTWNFRGNLTNAMHRLKYERPE